MFCLRHLQHLRNYICNTVSKIMVEILLKIFYLEIFLFSFSEKMNLMKLFKDVL